MFRTAFAVETGTVQVVSTERNDGNFAVARPAADLERRRAAIADGPWTAPRQVHGTVVLDVDAPGAGSGREADGAVTTTPGCVLSVTTADCAPVVLVAAGGVAVVHAGWRGLAAGVIEAAAERLGGAGDPVASWLGPCIGPDDYEFGADDLDLLVDRFGTAVASTTRTGTPALDLYAGVAAAVSASGFPVPDRPPSTADRRWFSHRVRGEAERQVTAAWIEAAP